MINVLCFHKFFCVAARYRDTIVDDDLALHVRVARDNDQAGGGSF